MTLNSELTALMDKARNLTGLTDKISIDRLTGLMNHFYLHINPNILTTTTFVPETSSRDSYEYISTGITLVNGWQYTFSCNTKSSDGKDHTVRYRLYDFSANETYPFNDDAVFQTNSSRLSVTFTVPNDGYKYQLLLYNSDKFTVPNWLVTFENCKLELGNLATPLNLLHQSMMYYLPNTNLVDNYDCALYDQSSTITMEHGKTYEVIAETNGYFSNDHEPNVESDKCVLWLTDETKYSQIISNSNTATGSTFVWNGDSGLYHLRVNAYHKGNQNKIYAYNIRIYADN